MNVSKPPLGIIPIRIHEYNRARELQRAIREYTAAGIYGDFLLIWIDELRDLISRRVKDET